MRSATSCSRSGIKVGDTVVAGDNVDILPGNCLPLKNIPLGTQIHNVELRPGKGGPDCAQRRIVGAARRARRAIASVKMPSGEIRKINVECVATIGQVGNLDHENVSIGKAGRSRWLGKRPHVRGVAMNPVDHPLGGGEGKTSGGRHPVSPWGSPRRATRPGGARTPTGSSSRGERSPEQSPGLRRQQHERSLKKGPFVDTLAPREGRGDEPGE